MKVRALIEQLLGYDMDAEVAIDTRDRIVWVTDVCGYDSYSGNAVQLELSEDVICERDVATDGMSDIEIAATPLGHKMLLGGKV